MCAISSSSPLVEPPKRYTLMYNGWSYNKQVANIDNRLRPRRERILLS